MRNRAGSTRQLRAATQADATRFGEVAGPAPALALALADSAPMDALVAPTAPLLTIDQAAAVLNVPRSWLRDKVTHRQVPHLRLGRHVRFAPEHLQRIITASEATTMSTAAPTGSRHSRRPVPAPGRRPQPGPSASA